jgi:hypothetical protein
MVFWRRDGCGTKKNSRNDCSIEGGPLANERIGGIGVPAKTRSLDGTKRRDPPNASVDTESTTHRDKILEELKEDKIGDLFVGSCPFNASMFCVLALLVWVVPYCT